MNHLLYNFSVIIIILGIVILTNSLSINSVKCKCKLNKKNKTKPIDKDIPSKVFDNMFDEPSVWMGYSDLDSNEFKLKK